MEALERNLILTETTRPCGSFTISSLTNGHNYKLNGQFVDDYSVYIVYYRILLSFIPIRMKIICFPRFGSRTIESVRAINIFDFIIVHGIFILIKLMLSSFLTTDVHYKLLEIAD